MAVVKAVNIFSKLFAILLIILLIFAGLLIFALGITNYDSSRMIMDHLSFDGSMKLYTEDLYHSYRILFMIVGAGISLTGVLGLVFSNSASQFMGRLMVKVKLHWKQFWGDAHQLWFDMTHPGYARWEWLILMGLILLAIIGRWRLVKRPMMHDESYTFIAFAQQPFMKMISDYSLPNNHVLNSILIHILYAAFGNISPAIVRSPALLAGVSCVPLVYVWARKQYGVLTAIVASALVGYFPWLKFQSTNGRGYMLMAMFTLLMLIFAKRVIEKKDLASWSLLIFFTVLNFYNLPIALYPFGIIGLWLLGSALSGNITADYRGFWHFFRYLSVYVVSSGFLTLLLYSPILLIGSGWDSLFNNPFVRPLDWDVFLPTLLSRLDETLKEWQVGVPLWFSILMGAGIILSVIFHKRSNLEKPALQFYTVIALLLIFVVQRPNPWARIWAFIVPMLLVWAAAGWHLFTESIVREEKFKRYANKLLMAALLIVTIALNLVHITKNLQYYHGELGQEETVTLALKEILNSDDIVLTSVGFGPAFWYYFDLHGMPMDAIVHSDQKKGWQRAFLIMDDREYQNPLEMYNGTQITVAECPLDSLQEIYEYGHYQVYSCSRKN